MNYTYSLRVLSYRRKLLCCITPFVLFSYIPQCAAYQALRVCETLAQGGLLDKTDRSITQALASREWHEVCTDRERRQQSYSKSSAQFQATIKAFGASGGGEQGEGMSSEEIDKACNKGEQAFSNYLSISEKIVRGSYLAQTVNDCLRIATREGQEFLSGTTEPVADKDDRFMVDFQFIPGAVRVDYVLDRIEGSENVKCFLGNDTVKTAIGVQLTAGLSLTCTRPDATGTNGRFIFTAQGGIVYTKRVTFNVSSVKAEARALDKLRDEYRSSLKIVQNELVSRVSLVKGEILGFLNSSVNHFEAKEPSFVSQCSNGQGGPCYVAAVKNCEGRGFLSGYIIGWAPSSHVTIACVGKKF